MINVMVKVFIFGIMGKNMMEIIIKIKWMDMENIIGKP